MAMVQEEQAIVRLDYASQIPSRYEERKINSMMLKLNRKKARLELR
jgi:hypothetical protein